MFSYSDNSFVSFMTYLLKSIMTSENDGVDFFRLNSISDIPSSVFSFFKSICPMISSGQILMDILGDLIEAKLDWEISIQLISLFIYHDCQTSKTIRGHKESFISVFLQFIEEKTISSLSNSSEGVLKSY